jgi:exonuclease V gamma subunit
MLFLQSAAQAMKKRVIVTHFTVKIVLRTGTRLVMRKFYLFKNILVYCGYSATSPFLLLLSEHKHCDNAATNSNSENARSRMVASLQGNMSMGTKEDESSTGRVWVAGFHYVTARSRLARVLKLTNRLFL